MPIVKEVAESIKLLGDVVKSTREIIKAVNDGREYLKRYYPDAQGDVSDLLQEMQRAVKGLTSVTKVFSGFRFVIAGTSINTAAANRDLARLNDYLIAQRDEVSRLKGQIRKLKADCDKVRQLRDRLNDRAKAKTWGSMFKLFGLKAQKRAQELYSALSNFYADDQRMIHLISDSLKLAEKALAEVENTLGPPGTASPYNVPLAAQVLGLYAVLFRDSHSELESLANDLNDARMALTS